MKPEKKEYIKITVKPHWKQFLVNELVAIMVFLGGFVYAGLFGLPFRSVAGLISSLLFLLLVYRYLYMKSHKYHISAEQLIIESGVIQHKTDYIELYRIVDFNESQSFIQRLVNTKTVIIHSGDRTTPTLKMVGIREATDIVGIIRDRVEYNKQKKGVYEITNR